MSQTLETNIGTKQQDYLIAMISALQKQQLLFFPLEVALMLAPLLASVAISTFSPSSNNWHAVASFCGIIAALFGSLFGDGLQKGAKAQVANLRELFETSCLGLRWDRMVAGSKPSDETINKLCRKHQKNQKLTSMAKDWLPAKLGTIPLPLGRLVYQREIVRSEESAYQKEFFRLSILAFTMIVSIWLYALLEKLSTQDLVLILLAPGAPILTWVTRQIGLYHDAWIEWQLLGRIMDEFWEAALEGRFEDQDLDERARKFQTKIYTLRLSGPLPIVLGAFAKPTNLLRVMPSCVEHMINDAIGFRV